MSNKTSKNGYTKIANRIIFDDRLSLKARSLLFMMLSHKETWKIYLNELLKHTGKDRKSAVQAGLKELVDTGYLKLVRVRNKSTNRLDGTHYEVIRDACQLLRQTDSPMTGKVDCQESAHLNKTETGINTKIIKNNNQQQNENLAAADDFKIEEFFEDLMQDKVWRGNFLTEPFGEGLLSEDNLDHLLFQFKYQSLIGGKAYKNANKAKEHFRNWFNRHREKESLLTSINSEKKQQKKLVEARAKILNEVASIRQTRAERTFPNIEVVLKTKARLVTLVDKLQQLQSKIIDAQIRQSFSLHIEELLETVNEINRGEKAGKLYWYCQNAPSSK